MHDDPHPQDYAPLSFGAGLALGLLLILALPSEHDRAKSPPAARDPALAHAWRQ